jgi:protein-L-isoaspartate(D-aspartate) O-methyltransferase
MAQPLSARRVPASRSVPGSVPSVRPRGVGLTSDRARAAMIDGLKAGGIRDPQVLLAMASVDRHRFIEAGLASRAYEDMSLPIGQGQTISRPFTVARMIELIAETYTPEQRRSARVLEVGTGCGYQAAVLAQVFGEVISIERIRSLHELARANLRYLRQANLRLVLGDGHLGSPEAAPFLAIIVAAAGASIPDALLLQMALGGRLIAPIQSPNGQQSLHFVERALPAEWRLSVLDAVRFVPMRVGVT